MSVCHTADAPVFPITKVQEGPITRTSNTKITTESEANFCNKRFRLINITTKEDDEFADQDAVPTIGTTQLLLRKMAPLALTTVLVAVALLMAYGLVLPALAQNDESALGSLNLTSDTPGEIEVSWTLPPWPPATTA